MGLLLIQFLLTLITTCHRKEKKNVSLNLFDCPTGNPQYFYMPKIISRITVMLLLCTLFWTKRENFHNIFSHTL